MGEKVDSAALKLNRLKHASAAYQVHKAIYTDYEGTGVDPESGINEGDHMAEGFMPWPDFREAFLKDWNNNRRIVDEKEADVHFDTLADEALTELESGTLPAGVTVDLVVDGVVAETTTNADEGIPLIPAVIAAPKRRGRPPGSGKAKAAAVVKGTAKRGRPAGSGKKVKAVAAKKKSGGGTSAKAQAIVEKFGPAGRKWARKDVIEKLTTSIDGLGAAYAATLYQKFA